jgi:ribonuclease G
MPKGEHIGVSQRIEDEAERDRLKNLIRQLKAESPDTEAGGFIVRTVAEGVSEHDLRRDMQFLVKLWRWVQERCVSAASPSLIYEELPLFLRTLRDLVNADVEKILIDSRETFGKVQDFVHEFMPQMQDGWSTIRASVPYLTCTMSKMTCKRRCSARSCSSREAI